MAPQQSHQEAFSDEINHNLNTRRILRLKTEFCLSNRAPMGATTRGFEPGQHSRLINPITQRDTFGYVPAIEGLPQNQPSAAPVILPLGRQSEKQSGFGARHILARHRDMLSTHEDNEEHGVAHFIATVLQNGACLFWQGRYGSSVRICAFRPGATLVILEYRHKHGKAFWNVITAYRARECEGDFVGSLIPATVHLAA